MYDANGCWGGQRQAARTLVRCSFQPPTRRPLPLQVREKTWVPKRAAEVSCSAEIKLRQLLSGLSNSRRLP